MVLQALWGQNAFLLCSEAEPGKKLRKIEGAKCCRKCWELEVVSLTCKLEQECRCKWICGGCISMTGY